MRKGASFFRLVGFELKKVFLSPMMPVFLAALLLLNGWKLSSEYQRKTSEFHAYQTVYEEFYSRWKGPITSEKVTELMTVFGPLEEKAGTWSLNMEQGSGQYTISEESDFRFFSSRFYNEIKYDYLYQNEAVRVAGSARTLAEFYAGRNAYAARKNAAAAELFRGRSIPQFADTQWVEVWLNHDYSAMMVLLMCLFGLCGVFVVERETEMYMLLRTTRFGSGITVTAKLTASALFALTLGALFFGEDVLLLQMLSGHAEALSSPVYAIRYLEATPLTMTIGQFLFWTAALKTLGVLCCGLGILLISCCCKRVLGAFVGGLGFLMALVVLQEACRTRMALKWFNPMELVMARELVTETTFINVFGQPVLLHGFVTAGILLTMAALTAGILLRNPGRAGRRRRNASV